MTVTLEQARDHDRRNVLKRATSWGFETPVRPFVLDAGGHVQAFEREDGAAPGGRFGNRHGKSLWRGECWVWAGGRKLGAGEAAKPILWRRRERLRPWCL